MDFFTYVPDDIVLIIFKFVEPVPELTALACTCRRLCKLSDNGAISKVLCNSLAHECNILDAHRIA